MKPLVLKFGGSSLSDSDKIFSLAARILSFRKKGEKPVCVLSAPADITDNLLSLSSKFSPSAREADSLLSTGEQISAALMAMALNSIGGKAISLNAWQAGIKTDSKHSDASIRAVSPERIKKELTAGRIPVITGFQGITPHGDLSTLGRGGSDASAVFISASLGAEKCFLFSDVKGVYTADPSAVANAFKLKKVSYSEIIKLGETGTEVRQIKAVKLASVKNVKLILAASFSDEAGTEIGPDHGSYDGIRLLSCVKKNEETILYLIGRGLKRSGKIEEKIRILAEKKNFGLRGIYFKGCAAEVKFNSSPRAEILQAYHDEFIKRGLS